MTRIANKPRVFMTRQPISQFVQVGHLRYHLRVWNPDGKTRVLALHGMRDASSTFQFLVDALPADWCVIAPDWRGHGQTGWDQEEYFFSHYLADLDALLDHLSPGAPLRIIGHSLGGNAASIYAGVKPERVLALASLDGFGLQEEAPDVYPGRLRKWLSQRAALKAPRPYPDIAAMAQRLMMANPRLDEHKALFLAGELSTPLPDGSRVWAFDPKHRVAHPYLFRFAEWAACFAQATMPVLWLGSDRPVRSGAEGLAQERVRAFPNARYIRIPDTGHNLHHDAPERVAAHLTEFFSESPAG